MGDALMEPLPFFSLVRTRPGSREYKKRQPLGLGIVLGRSEGLDGWHYSVMVGELCWHFRHDELIPLGWTVDRGLIYGTDEDLEAMPAENVLMFGGRDD